MDASTDARDDRKSEHEADEDVFNTVDDTNDEISNPYHTSAFHSLPLDGDGSVKDGLVLEMSRCSFKEPHAQRGFMFVLGEGNDPVPTLFAKSEAWMSKASREELVFQRGLSGPDSATPAKVGTVNFHHWLVDQSRAVIVEHEGYSGGEIDLRRSGLTSTHKFSFRDQNLSWSMTSESLEEPSPSRMSLRKHLQCQDEDGNILASYTRERSCFSSRSKDQFVGRFHVRHPGLDPVLVEVMIMTFVALHVKLQKRKVQGSQAGVAGGLGTAVSYAVGG